MDNEKGKPRRKELRIKQYDYSSKGAYFITVCIKDRAQMLSDIINPVGVGALDDPEIRLTQMGRIVEKYLLSSENISGVTIDKYVIMPDHIHAIIFLDGNSQNVELSNLKLVSRKELLIMNRQKLFGATSELTEAGINIAKLYDAKYKAEKRKEENK